MKKINGLVLFLGGATMMIAAFHDTAAVGVDFSMVLAGGRPDHVIWMLAGGAALMALGLTRRLGEARKERP